MNELAKNTENFLEDESGLSTIEVVLILVVLVSLVIIFKDRITTLLGKVFDQVDSQAESVCK